MEWSVFALLQMFILTVSVSLAFWLRLRAVHRLNESMRQQATATAAAQKSPQDWLQEKIDALSHDDPASAVAHVILSHVLQDNDNLTDALTEAIQANELMPAVDAIPAESAEQQSERISELETELAAAQATFDALPGDSSDERTEVLTNLLQQLTKDSRDLMGCIHTLEAENAQLREQLGIDETSVANSPTAEEDAA